MHVPISDASYPDTNSLRSKDLNVKERDFKMMLKNIEAYFHDIWLGKDFLNLI